jgi:nucleoside-diphosphate-sugar epimerase
MPGLEIVTGALSDEASLAAAVQGTEVVFHIAALFRAAKFPDSEYWKVNLEGTKHVMRAAKKAGVKKFIHCSTIGVHSHIVNPPADETEPYAPTDVYQESKMAGEIFVREELEKGSIQGCIIRPAMIWGPGDTRFLKFFKGIFRRKFPLIGTGDNLCHFILVSDLARVFRLAAESDKSNGQTYIIAGERPVTLKYTMQTIARYYNTSLNPIRIPVALIQCLGSITEAICKPFRVEPPLHRHRADFFIKNRAFNVQKAISELGFCATYTFEEEARLIATWYLEHGWLL